MASTGMWTGDSSAQSFKPISKWRILRIFFSCTRIWRDVGRQAENLRVRYTLDLQFKSIEVTDQDSLKPSQDSTLVSVSDSSEDKQLQQRDKPRRGVVLFPLVLFPPQPNSGERPQPVLAVVAFSAVFLSLECDQYYPPDHVDWGGDLGTKFLLGTLVLGSKNTCVSIVTLFQAASILLFQAAYFWLKFREAASSSGRKRKLSDRLQGCDQDVHQSSWRGVYARAIKDRGGKFLGYKYEPRFKPPRERTGDGQVLIFQNLPLGSYSDPLDAQVVRHIAAFYYGKEIDLVSLGEGRTFTIPATSHHGLSGHQKAKWVSEEAKKLFDLYCKPTEGPQPGNQPCTQTCNLVSEVFTELDNMVEIMQPSRPVQDAAEGLNKMRDIREFLLGDSEDVALGNQVELHQPEWLVQSLEGGAATSSCKWSLEALASEDISVPMLSPHQGFNAVAGAAPATGAPSDFCSKNCIADLLVRVVSRQCQQIEELKHKIECLKGLK